MEWAGYGSAYVDVFIKMFQRNTERMRHFLQQYVLQLDSFTN
jgi:TorA maturation chaperone TorD